VRLQSDSRSSGFVQVSGTELARPRLVPARRPGRGGRVVSRNRNKAVGVSEDGSPVMATPLMAGMLRLAGKGVLVAKL